MFVRTTKGVFIATQLNSTRFRVELRRYRHPLRPDSIQKSRQAHNTVHADRALNPGGDIVTAKFTLYTALSAIIAIKVRN